MLKNYVIQMGGPKLRLTCGLIDHRPEKEPLLHALIHLTIHVKPRLIAAGDSCAQ